MQSFSRNALFYDMIFATVIAKYFIAIIRARKIGMINGKWGEMRKNTGQDVLAMSRGELLSWQWEDKACKMGDISDDSQREREA